LGTVLLCGEAVERRREMKATIEQILTTSRLRQGPG
jgi:hypothetical protein